jgi:hypothetical protein
MINSPAVDIAPLISATDNWAATASIDATANLGGQKIWLFSGYNDGVVKTPVVDALYAYYQHYVAAGNIYYQDNLNAAHAQITDGYGQSCNTTGGEFINNCGYDAAGNILQHIYGKLQPRNTGTLSSNPIPFDQSAFYNGDITSIGMATIGYIYVPASCQAQQACRIHVALHGCLQNAETIGDHYYANAGYNQWADTNNIIVLYPQTTATLYGGANPKGCWDWWGYNAANYAQQSGDQIAAIRGMLATLTASYTGWNPAPGGAFAPPSDLTAAASSTSRVALFWTGVGQAAYYNVYRASCSGCSFNKLNPAPVTGPSYADSALSPNTPYYYKVRAIDSSGNESGDSNLVAGTTAAPRPFCDPYYRSVYQHWSEGRSWTTEYETFAYGSNQFIGYTGPSSLVIQALLTQSAPASGYFSVGAPCN